MLSLYAAEHSQHAPGIEFWNGRAEPTVEVPARVEAILKGLKNAGLADPQPVTSVDPAEIGTLLAHIHTRAYLDYLPEAYERWVESGGDVNGVMPFISPGKSMQGIPQSGLARPGLFAFDMGALIKPGTAHAAYNAALTAFHAAQAVAQGQRAAYALCRPPGHHAGANFYGGYCYLNNAALAVETLRSTPGYHFERLAVLDIDVHHGNGTQDIFYGSREVLTVSLHMDPAHEYPFFAGYREERGLGAGEGYNINYPLPFGIQDANYLAALKDALDEIANFNPAALVVALGVDTYRSDPIGKFALSLAAYPKIGKEIARLSRPTVFVQEGGYDLNCLGDLVSGVLVGFENNL